eukprot:TRINITY_DN23385_c0_g1_i1.p1 TRINITY_DN23385_c0_g1~~TRINITY_DN23385_c0_g1_i1.p1  ORF type:complete len:176 (+),score=25.56 TRINITY_DN23385_c0_g1_i1:69-530(+)
MHAFIGVHSLSYSLSCSQYIESAKERNMDRTEIVSFLFQLSFMSLGQCYSKASLSPTQFLLISDLEELGLIYTKSEESSVFYPTQLAIFMTIGAVGLTNSQSALSQRSGLGHIIVENNYKVFAYVNHHHDRCDNQSPTGKSDIHGYILQLQLH